MEFICPKCRGTRLEEVMAEVTVTSVINEVDEGGVTYGEQTNEDGEVLHYNCVDCGESIKDDAGNPIKEYEELHEWLKHRGMVE